MRGRNVKETIKRVTLASGLVMFVGCSGQQQQEENLETTEGNEEATNQANENLGQDDAAEGNGQENYVDNNEGAQQTAAQGAETNSATEEIDPTLDNSGAAAAPVNTAAATPVNTAAATPAAAPAGGPGSIVPGGRVRYVKEGGVQAVNAPGGQPVMMIEQGEHPVTWEENGYLKIADGVYVPVDALSDKGIPRAKTSGGWN